MNQQLENKPEHYVLALLDNLFFAAKIIETARQSGLAVISIRTVEKAYQQVNIHCPSLIIVDLDATNCQPLSLITLLKEDEKLDMIPTVGFVAHINTAVQTEARAAGVQRVLARSVFSRDLPLILKEFANPEAH
jgi:PleD family two-component response regulator